MVPASDDPPPLNLRGFLTFRLARLQSQINSQAQHILRTHADVGQSEWRVLALVGEHDVCTMARIVREGQMDKAQVSRAVKSLTDKGYLSTRLDPFDHRQTILSLTASGSTLRDRIMPLMRARQRHLMSGLTQEEVETMFELIGRIETAAERRDF